MLLLLGLLSVIIWDRYRPTFFITDEGDLLMFFWRYKKLQKQRTFIILFKLME